MDEKLKLMVSKTVTQSKLNKDWVPLEKHVFICNGHTSQSHKKYKGHGEQGAAVCIVACSFAHLQEMNLWTKDHLDNILEIGTKLYLRSRLQSENRCSGPLKPPKIYKYFFVNNLKISTRIGVNILKERHPRDTTIYEKIENLLKKFLVTNSSGVLNWEETYFAIWSANKYYYIFDPKEHDETGNKWCGLPSFGYCYCIRSNNLKTLADIIIKNCDLKQINKFTIYPCSVEKVVIIQTKPPDEIPKVEPLQFETPKRSPKKSRRRLFATPEPTEKPKTEVPEGEVPEGEVPEAEAEPQEEPKSELPPERPKLESVTNFSEVSAGFGILRASTHQSDPKFSKYPGTQSYGNAIAAITMLRHYKSKKWVKNIADDILRLGEQIQHDLKKLQDGEKLKKIVLYEQEFYPKIDRYGVVGRLQSDDDKVLSLDQALRNTLIDDDCCILTGPNIVAIWREGDKYYMFDPEERDASGLKVEDGEEGVACVTWYQQLSKLLEIYFNNIPQEQRNDKFLISKIAIKDYEPIADDWCNFKALNGKKWILRGTFSQKDRRFPEESRNSQCTANAAMALAYKELKNECEWNSEIMDTVLINGDEYYRNCVQYLQDSGKFKNPHLLVDELQRSFNAENKRVKMEIDDCLINGILNASSNTEIPNLRKGFEFFFANSDGGIVTANSLSMAVWKKDNTFYYYDSHSRNEKGLTCGFGTACVLRLVNIEDLANSLLANLGSDSQNLFNISRVDIKLLDITDDGFVKPPLNFYQPINDLVAILRASSSQKDPKFFINAGKQQVANCLAALALNKISSSFDWSKEELNQVLILGDKLYSESMEANLKEEVPEEANVDDITTNNVQKNLKIGTNLFEMEFEDLVSGNLEDNLKEAIENLEARGQEGGLESFQSILESEFLTVALWKDENLYYLFDPRPRDEYGHVYGKDDWSVKIEEMPEEEQEPEEELTEDPESEFKELPDTEEERTDDENRDEMAGGDNLGAPEEEVGQTEYDEALDYLEDQEGEEEEEEGEEEEEPEIPQIEKKGSEYWRIMEDQGKSCILRFSRLDDLIQHILDNSPPNRRQEIEFNIKGVQIANTPILHELQDPEIEEKEDEFVGNWNNFEEFDYGMWILRSSVHWRSKLFPECNRGKQDLAMCLTAACYGYLFNFDKFTTDNLNQMIAYGDRLHTVARKLTLEALKKMNKKNMPEEQIEELLNRARFKLSDYPHKMCLSEIMVGWEFAEGTIEGDLTSKDPETVHNLLSGLEKFFELNHYAIIECKKYPVAIWKDDESMYYMFDLHPCGPSGKQSTIGVACITRFKQLEDLVKIYEENLPKLASNFFKINSFSFTKGKCLRQRHPEVKVQPIPKIGGFGEVVAGKSILRGDLKFDCTKFARGVHMHSAPIAFVALALSLNKDPDTWTRLIVNEILVIGEELYNDSIDKLGEKFNPWSEHLDIWRVNLDFQIGRLKVNCAIRFTEQKGIVDIKNSKILNLRQGIEKFFEENTHGILIADKFILSLWEQTKDSETHIYMFDPNSRGSTGLPGQGGVACVMKFLNAKLASDHIMSCMMDIDKTKTQFSIVPIEIVVGAFKTKRKICPGLPVKSPCECESTKGASRSPLKPATCPDKSTLQATKRQLRAIAAAQRQKNEQQRCQLLGRKHIHEINTNQAIIRGLRSIILDRELPVNIMAFVFMRIATDLNKWTYKNIELILESGYQLYVDSYNTYKPEIAKLSLGQVLRRIILKDYEAKISIKKPILGLSLNTENLYNHLTNFFMVANFCMVNYKGFLISVYFKSGYFYLFDPYSRDLFGNASNDGCAMLMRFGDLQDMVSKIVKNFADYDANATNYALIYVTLEGVEPLQ